MTHPKGGWIHVVFRIADKKKGKREIWKTTRGSLLESARKWIWTGAQGMQRATGSSLTPKKGKKGAILPIAPEKANRVFCLL